MSGVACNKIMRGMFNNAVTGHMLFITASQAVPGGSPSAVIEHNGTVTPGLCSCLTITHILLQNFFSSFGISYKSQFLLKTSILYMHEKSRNKNVNS